MTKEQIDNPICIREVNENIRRVETGQPLTRSLKELNTNCEFKKKYREFDKIIHPDLEIKAKIAKQNKAYREANKDKIAKQKKAYYEANKDKIAKQKKAYREANKDKIAKQKKAWYERRNHVSNNL